MKIRVLTINGKILSYDHQAGYHNVVSVSDPTVITSLITEVTSSGAKCGGTVYDGGQPITERGICWSLLPTPTILDYKTSDGTGSGTFISTMAGLLYSTTYYVRAYAINIVGLMYGEERIFTTEEDFKLIFGGDTDILTWELDTDSLIWN